MTVELCKGGWEVALLYLSWQLSSARKAEKLLYIWVDSWALQGRLRSSSTIFELTVELCKGGWEVALYLSWQLSSAREAEKWLCIWVDSWALQGRLRSCSTIFELTVELCKEGWEVALLYLSWQLSSARKAEKLLYIWVDNWALQGRLRSCSIFELTVEICKRGCDKSSWAREAEELPLLEAVAREPLVKAQQGGKGLSGTLVIYDS
jgi:hypothetical protein